jgi:hypothetical protein
MAEHATATEIGTATGNDLAAHEGTYESFLKLVRRAVIGLVILLILMAIVLV